MNRIRVYHATLAILALAAYLSGESGAVHAYLGYAVAAVILLRLAWAAMGERQLGLQRFYGVITGPHIQAGWTHPAISLTLISLISVCLFGVVGTGIALDRGRAFAGIAESSTTTTLAPSPSTKSASDPTTPTGITDDDNGEDENGGGTLKGIHELFANALLILVPLHVFYLLVFKRALAKYMLFFPRSVPGP